MPFVGAEIKEVFEELKQLSPDLIFTHYRKDAHQDHRLIAELTGQTFRDHLILEYEIPKYDGDLGHPNMFVPLERTFARRRSVTSSISFSLNMPNAGFAKIHFSPSCDCVELSAMLPVALPRLSTATN